MYFSDRKLSTAAKTQLVEWTLDSMKPFALLYAPVYLYFKENEKYVSIKGPLDFFTPEEIKKISSRRTLFFSDFINSTTPFARNARDLKKLLKSQRKMSWMLQDESSIELSTSPIPYEMNNEVLKIVGPLWWELENSGTGIEPFYVTVFINELCDAIPSENLVRARENTIEKLELALLVSSWAVLLALLLGYTELDFLNYLRLESFNAKVEDRASEFINGEIEEAVQAADISLWVHRGKDGFKAIRAEFFTYREGRVYKKIGDRLARVKKEFLSRGDVPSIYGMGGFVHD